MPPGSPVPAVTLPGVGLWVQFGGTSRGPRARLCGQFTMTDEDRIAEMSYRKVLLN